MRQAIHHFTVLLLACVAVVATAPAVSSQNVRESRVALIIGNASYKDSPLRNPGNDAQAMADKLQALGFKVILRQNIEQRQIGSAIADFRNAIIPGGVALFYYAGHGVQVRGENFLPAVDASIQTQDDVPNQSINLNQVLAAMEEGKSHVNLVFLDACRNNPYTRGFRSTATGLAQVNAPSGTLIHFATRPGSVAFDGNLDDRNGLYTTQLLKAIDQPGLAVEQVMKHAASGVKLASNGRQEPWMEGNLDGDFYFRPRQSNAEQVQTLLQQSTTAFAAKRHSDVVDLSREILVIDPRETTALANMAAAYLQLGRLDEASEVVNQSLVINPAHAPSLNNRGVLRERSGHVRDALADYQRGCHLASAQGCRNAERLSQRSDVR